MQVLHGGDAARDHLEGGKQRIEPQIHIAQGHARGKPQFERVIRRSQLEGRKPHMVMRVDHPRHHDLAAPAKGFRLRMRGLQRRGRANARDLARLDQQGGILMDDRRTIGRDALDDAIRQNQPRAHAAFSA